MHGDAKASTRRRWSVAQPSFPEALVRIRRDGFVLETFLPEEVGPVTAAERWDGKRLEDVLGAEMAALWIGRIGTALDQRRFTSERFQWSRPGSHLVFEVRIVPCGPDEILGIAREVGYQERLEAERNAMHALLERATDLLPDLVYVFDHAEDRVMFQNRSITEELGYSPERCAELGENPIPLVAHPDDLSMMPEILARTLAASDDDVLSYEGRFRAADGSWRWYVTHSRIFARRADGTPTQVFGVMRNVTEQRALEQRVHRAAKVDALGAVAGSIAHDFNNALTAIHGFAELLEGEVSEQGKNDLAELSSAIDGAKSLASRVLSFSRAEHRRLEPLDLAQLVRKVEPLLSRMLGATIRLELELPAEPPVVRADPQELEQVLVNLALNARDAMPKGGVLRIQVDVDAPPSGASFSEESGRWVRLAVSDTGEGMSPEVHDRAFEPFFTTKATGTGLGLASARLAVEYAGGTLVGSSRPGRGTTFLVRLPWCATPPLAPSTGAPAAARAGRGTVLVVDDEPMVLRLIDATLRRSGYRVLSASGHHGALRIAADPSEPIDLLVSDVVMPEMNGPELATRIRELRPALPILFVSGFHDESQIPTQGAAATTLLRKPFSPRQLSEIVAGLLSAAPSPDRSRP
jgi:PAS domain S-box-containing protein